MLEGKSCRVVLHFVCIALLTAGIVAANSLSSPLIAEARAPMAMLKAQTSLQRIAAPKRPRKIDNKYTKRVLNGPACGLVVTNTDDSGAGSLRDAIDCANISPGTDTITFNIPGTDLGCDGLTGICTIVPSNALPVITGPVIIDGYSQPGATPNTDPTGDNANILIALTGGDNSGTTFPVGQGMIDITAGNSTVKGLAIFRYITTGTDEAAIRLSGAGGNTITGNFLGPDPTGSCATIDCDNNNPPSGNVIGVLIDNVPNNIVGGPVTDIPSAAIRNLITDNGTSGVLMRGASATGNRVQGNFIGTDRTGTQIEDANANPFGNFIGILINGSSNNIIGNSELAGLAVAGAANVISGNNTTGIEISGATPSTGNGIGSNFIGTDLTGTLNLRNGYEGVEFGALSRDNLLGGTTTDFGNVIANNFRNGVAALSTSLTGNRIRLNSIHDNFQLGIDLNSPDGITYNDYDSGGNVNGDPDTGPNDLQNFPTITSADGGTTTVAGTLNSTPGETFTIDVYSNITGSSSGYGEGQTYLGSVTTAATDANGDVAFSVTVPALSGGQALSTTATDLNGSTSEFSEVFTVTGPVGQPVDTAITAPPDGSTTGGTGSIFFEGSGGTGPYTFECDLDAGGLNFVSCGSGVAFNLPSGPHTFQARATDSLGDPDITPASITWTVDADGPVVTNVTGPTDPTTSKSAHFTFELSDISIINDIHCVLDGSDTFCGTGNFGSIDYSNLIPGPHTFEVYGVDVFQNIGSRSSYPWTINSPTAAGISVTGRVNDANGRGIRNARISVTGTDGQVISIMTGPQGYYTVEHLNAGYTYILSIASSKFRFAQPTRLITLTDSMTSVDWVAEPQE